MHLTALVCLALQKGKMRTPSIYKCCQQRTSERGEDCYCKKSQSLPNLNYEHFKFNRIYWPNHKTRVPKENLRSAEYLRQAGSQSAGKLKGRKRLALALLNFCTTTSCTEQAKCTVPGQPGRRKSKLQTFHATGLLKRLSKWYMDLSTPLPHRFEKLLRYLRAEVMEFIWK